MLVVVLEQAGGGPAGSLPGVSLFGSLLQRLISLRNESRGSVVIPQGGHMFSFDVIVI